MDLQEEKDFIKRCEKDLPKFLNVDGIGYKLYAHGFLAGGFEICYGGFDGNFFDWGRKLLDLHYKIVEIIPPPINYRKEDIWHDSNIYKLSMDDVIADCLEKLEEACHGKYIPLDEIVPKETLFYRELTSLLNKYSKENSSNTPDFVLAGYLNGCLSAFNNAVNNREEWYGRKKKK